VLCIVRGPRPFPRCPWSPRHLTGRVSTRIDRQPRPPSLKTAVGTAYRMKYRTVQQVCRSSSALYSASSSRHAVPAPDLVGFLSFCPLAVPEDRARLGSEKMSSERGRTRRLGTRREGVGGIRASSLGRKGMGREWATSSPARGHEPVESLRSPQHPGAPWADPC